MGEERSLRVFENSVLRIIFGPKWVQVRGNNQNLNILYCTSNIISNKLERNEMGRVYGDGNRCIEFWCGNLRERDHRGDPGVDGMIILRLIFRKWDWAYGLGRAGSG